MLTAGQDRITEPMARFYVAEMVLAIDSLHSLGYAHRCKEGEWETERGSVIKGNVLGEDRSA